MSSICTEFVQNAWKKDLCSNCFKAKADHASALTGNEPLVVARQDGSTPPVSSTDLLTTASTKSANLEITNGGISAGQGSASGCSFNKGHSETATINNNNNNVVVANNQLNSCGNLRFIKNKSNILNSNGHAAAFRKIGSSGVHLWEVGHLPGKSKVTESAEAYQVNGVKGDVAEVDQKSNSETSNGNNKFAVSGILKEATKVLQNGSSKTKLNFGNSSERRGSVGFINESPQVIGYGGADYEWDDQDSNPEDEPSDLDSLENFEMSEEDKAFCQLTDRNTEYNSDNANLSTVLGHGTEQISVPDDKPKSPMSNGRHFQRVQSEVDLKLKNLHLEVENPSDNRQLTELDATRSDYLENDEREDDDDDDDGTMIVKLPTSDTDDVLAHPPAATTTTAGYRTGSETVPSRKYPSTPRTSVLKLFSEEPVTTAEVQAAIGSSQPLNVSTEEWDAVTSSLSLADEKSGPAAMRELPNRHLSVDNYAGVDCSPYDVVPLSSLQKGNACSNKIYGSLQAPTVPSCPPPSADDESQKLPLSAKMATKTSPFGTNRFQSHPVISKQMSAPEQSSSSCSPKNYSSSGGRGEPKSTVGLCSTFCSPANNDSTESRFRNREYAAVNYSCHYAASYISTGVRTDDGSAKRASAALVSDLPPTPLTNPYSSTAILKGIPHQQHHDSTVEQSPQKPPVTRPKPKLPLKPVGHQPRSFEDNMSLTRSAESGADKDLKSEEAPIRTTTLSDMQVNHFQHHLPGNGHVIGAATEPQGGSSYYPDVGKSNAFQMSSITNEDMREPDTLAEQKSLSTFESKVATLSNSLDFSKRTPKRQAPRPPTGIQQESPVQFMKIDRTSTSSLVSDDGHHLPITGHKVACSLSMDRCTSSSKVFCNDVNVAHTFDRRSSPTSQLVTLTSTDLGSSAHGGLTGGSSASTSMSSLNGSYYDGSHRGLAKDTPHKEGKLRKSKFSLKKLLKFGTKDDGDDSSKLKAGRILHFGSSHQQERKGKLEILHPIDLINAGSPQHIDGLSLDKKSTETPVTSSVYGSEGTPASVGLTTRVYPKDEMESSHLMEDHSDEVSRNKPPPPPRSRSHGEEHTKDKPIRPPPPAKSKHQELHGSQDDLSDPVPVLRRKHDRSSPLSQEQRNSLYSSAMEYANLGDVRNTLTPKKPGRCPSNSMIDITYGQHMANSGYREDEDDQVTAANEKVEVTYYEPPGDLEVENVQRIVPDELPEENVNPDNNASAPLLAVQQGTLHVEVAETGVQHLEQHSKNFSDSSGKSDSKKIYERVVLKKGNLEKVYAKLPVAPLEPNDSSVPSTMISDVDDVDSGGLSLWPRRKSSRLSLRKAKTVVHKNLEDNYGAVVTANHQTLIQILEQVSLTQPGMASKARLLEEVPPHWSDFKLLEDCQVTMVGGKAFFSAVWQQNVELTLMASQEPLCVISQSTRNPCVLTPFVEFEDAIPCGFFTQCGDSSNETYCNGTIWVLERMRVETLTSVAESLHLQCETDMESYEREVCFILLQVINCLKHLQVLGIEEMDANYGDFALIMKNNDVNYRLVILPQVSSVSDGYRTLSAATGSQQKLSLCQSAISAMMLLLNVDNGSCGKNVPGPSSIDIPSGIPSREAFCKIADSLNQERATSLSQAKLLLEYLLWGPSDLQGELQANSNCVDQEQAYQRWLDLERATVLNNLIRTQSLWQIRLTVFEEYMLSFLVRTCAKMLREASSHLLMNRAKISS